MDSKTHNAVENLRTTFRGAVSVDAGALRDAAIAELVAIDGNPGSEKQIAGAVRGARKVLKAAGVIVR
jgi:hypothetical protein